MKMSFKNIIKWSFWPLLCLFVFCLYFVLPKEQKQEHLALIPSDANFVVVANPMKVFVLYADLLANQPDALKGIDSDFEDESPSITIGINPLKKVALFHFSNEKKGVSGIAILAKINKFDDFINTFNSRKEKPMPTAFSGGEYVIVQKDDQVFVKKNGVGVVIYSMGKEISTALAEQYFDYVFNNENYLLTTEESFAEVANSESQVNYWSAKGNNIVKKINAQLGKINGIFDRKNVKINLTENGFEIEAKLELASPTSIIPRAVVDLELIGDESFRFGASVAPQEFKDFFELIIPDDKAFFLKDWTGSISASVSGFRNVSIRKIVPKQHNHSDPDLYPFHEDTVDVIDVEIPFLTGGINENFSFPFFNIACEIGDVSHLKEQLEQDTTISNVGDYYSYVLEDYVLVATERDGLIFNKQVIKPQRIYFYFVENSIVFCPELPDVDFVPQYTTFGTVFQFDPMVKTYQAKGMIDDMVISKIGDFGMKGFTLQFDRIENGNSIILKGVFNLKDTENHIVGFPLFIKNVLDNSPINIMQLLL